MISKAASGAWQITVPAATGMLQKGIQKIKAMPFTNLLRSTAGTCRYCGNKAGVLTRDHPDCKAAHQSGWNQMVELAADAARSHQFDEKTFRLTLAEIAKNAYGDGNTVNQTLEEGWKRGVGHAMADGIITQQEELRLREFRDRLALDAQGADQQAAQQLEKASTDRLTLDARLAAVAVNDPDAHLNDLTVSLRASGCHRSSRPR